jgi:exportin-7
MDNTGGVSKCDEKLEIAILHFFKLFKKVFLLDTGSSSSSSGGMASIPGGSPVHPMLSNILSSYTSIEIGNVAGVSDTPEVLTIYKAMGIGEQPVIMNMIVNKLCNNIKYWNKSPAILETTLEVFVELISTYSSSKALLVLESVNYLVHNHTGNDFPFLGYEYNPTSSSQMCDNKYRTVFYSALSRLVFSSSEDVNNQFDVFIAPNVDIVQKLNQSPNLRDVNIRLAIIGIMRDLRGISSSTYNKRTYNLLFEILLPDLFPLMIRIAETWYDDAVVMTALFKFMQEFVFNKNQRILFDQSSANGILLFRETSSIVCAYGNRILEVPVQNDIYIEKYKGIRLMLNTLTCSLSGNYVNFGVFNLYQDRCLQEALDVALQTCLQIPISDVLSYVKLAKAYFAFLEVLFRSHLDVLSGLDNGTFIKLIKSNHEGLQSSDVTICALCASTIDHLATYMFLHMNKDKPTVRLISSHVASEPDILNDLMSSLFNTLLFTPQANQWAVTRPILSLLLASESSYNEYQRSLIESQSEINRTKLFDEFVKLTAEIQKSVEIVNRDKFTQKLTVFRLNVRAFLTL